MSTYTIETNDRMEQIIDEVAKRMSMYQPDVNILRKDVVQTLFLSALIDYYPLVRDKLEDVVE